MRRRSNPPLKRAKKVMVPRWRWSVRIVDRHHAFPGLRDLQLLQWLASGTMISGVFSDQSTATVKAYST
jgi:hypothetical protein